MSAPPPAVADADPGAADTPKTRGKLKLVVIAAVLLLIAAGAGLWFSGILPKLLGHGKAAATARQEAAVKPPAAPVFVDLPDIIANLNAPPRHQSFIKLKVKVELARPEDQAAFSAATPRLLDLFQTYLREMRPEELHGSAGTYRLREELIARANIAAAPAQVSDVLFVEMLIQ